MSKRREQFESQLRDLQKDISTLSHKLNVTTSAYIHPVAATNNGTTIGSSNGNHVKGSDDALSKPSIKSIDRFNTSTTCLDNNQVLKVS